MHRRTATSLLRPLSHSHARPNSLPRPAARAAALATTAAPSPPPSSGPLPLQEVLKQTAALLAPLSSKSENAKSWLLRLDQMANANPARTVVVGSRLSGTALLLPTLLDEPLRGDSAPLEHFDDSHDLKLILNPTLDSETFSTLYHAEAVVFLTDTFTLASSASRSDTSSSETAPDLQDPTLELLKYFSAKPGTSVLINHLDDSQGGTASETQDLHLLSSALGPNTIDHLVRPHISTASGDAHAKLPVSSINIGAAVRANATLRQALAFSEASLEDDSSAAKAALWDQFMKLYESSALGSIRPLLLPPPPAFFDLAGSKTKSDAALLFALQHALSDVLSLCARRRLRIEAVDGVVGVLDDEVDGLARRMVEDALEAGKSHSSLGNGRRRAGGVLLPQENVAPPTRPAPADLEVEHQTRPTGSIPERIGSFWTAMVDAVRSDPVLRSDRSRSPATQVTDSRSMASFSDPGEGAIGEHRHVLPSLTDRRRAGAVEEAFRGRLALWKLLLLGRSDEVGLVLEQAVSRSFAKEEEEKLIFQAGRLYHLASETVQRTEALINSALTASTETSASPPEGAHSPLAEILSPTQLNATRAGLPTHHTHRYVLNDPYILARPIAKRRAQLLGSKDFKSGSVIDALVARTQSAVLRTYLLLVPAGILAGGPYLSRFLLGTGVGASSGAGASKTTATAAGAATVADQAGSHAAGLSATSALEYLASLDPHTALPLSALLTLSAIYMLQSSYTKAKRRFWKDLDALAHNLASDVGSNAQEVVRAHVGAYPRGVRVQLEGWLRGERVEVDRLQEGLSLLRRRLEGLEEQGRVGRGGSALSGTVLADVTDGQHREPPRPSA